MGALQEMPQTEMFQTITKASFTIAETAKIPELLMGAFKTALTGRPGPVFIEIPFDVLFNATDPPEGISKVEIASLAPKPEDMNEIISLVKSAQKPMIIAGTQVYWDGASAALITLTEQTGIPVVTNGAGRGTLSMTHPNCLKTARGAALKEADVVILIGTPLDFRLKYGREGWNPEGKLIQVENDEGELNHNRKADIAVIADCRLLLEKMAEGLKGARFDGWLGELQGIEKAKKDKLESWKANDDVPINHFRFAAELNKNIDEDMIVIGDGGDIISACAKVLDITAPGQWLDPGPLGCLGAGAPFAIAAKALHPEKKVLIIHGDGSFGLNGFEFDTALRHGLPIVSIVGNDSAWGQIRAPQVKIVGKERAIGTSLAPTRYDKIVEAMGGYGEHVEHPEEIAPALDRAFASGKAACINVPLDPEGMANTGASTPYIV
jgi:acetolactate synthase-1/2/3 large subunit